MSFLNPAALWFALIVVPIIIFYLLKIRRKEVEISSTLLWRMALRDQQANAPWQKLKRNLLLLLQLIVLGMMVLAVARLAFPLASVASGSVVLLIDGSASMFATDESPDRFSSAVRIAGDLLRETGASASASAILVTHQPRVLFTGETDRNEALRILAEAEAGLGEGDWAAAFSLASGLVFDADQPEQTTYIILSDGGLPEKDLPPLPGETQYIPIGRDQDNLAVTALAARVLPGRDTAELFVRVTNYGNSERAARLSISKGNEAILNEQMRLLAGDSAQFVVENLPVEDAVFIARLSNIQADLPLDDLPIDDSAYAVLVPPSARRVLLVSPGNLFLERLLLLFPNLNASKTQPDETGDVHLGSESFDLFIFDGVLPADELPEGQLLLIHPPENDLVVVSGEIVSPTRSRTTDHPLAQFIDWTDVNVFKTKRLAVPPWFAPLVTAEETPLVLVGEQAGRRIAVVGFDLHASDLPLKVAFPILFATLFEFLAPHGIVADPNGARAFEPVPISPRTGTQTLSVTSPGGFTQLFENPGANTLFTRTDELGLYTVRASDGENFEEAFFAVNLFSENESDIAVREQIEVGRRSLTATGRDEVSNREVWGWLIGLALLFLLLEWLAYHRRLG